MSGPAVTLENGAQDHPPEATLEPEGRWSSWARSADLSASVLIVSGLVVAFLAILTGWIGVTIVVGNSMEPTIASGDLVLTRPQPSYSVGDIVVFEVPEGQPGEGSRVIHRITGVRASGFETTGDNRAGADIWTPSAADIVGSPELTLPAVGTLLRWLRSPILMALLIASAAFHLALRAVDEPRDSPEQARPEPEEFGAVG